MSDTSMSQVIPTFEEVRRRARGHLSQARDWLNSDWSDDGPSFRQASATNRAAKYISLAKAALDEAARRPEDRS